MSDDNRLVPQEIPIERSSTESGYSVGHLVWERVNHWPLSQVVLEDHYMFVALGGKSITSTPTIWKGRSTGIGTRGGGRCRPDPETTAHSGHVVLYIFSHYHLVERTL